MTSVASSLKSIDKGFYFLFPKLFLEIFSEEPLFWKGLGLNASQPKLLEKEKKHELYPGYGLFNFHNQYVQNFAELGFCGFALLIIMLFLNIKTAITHKNFIHISFAVLKKKTQKKQYRK